MPALLSILGRYLATKLLAGEMVSLALNSHVIRSASYNLPTRTLTLTFDSGTYDYSPVDPSTVAGLLTAPSPTGYFARHIRE